MGGWKSAWGTVMASIVAAGCGVAAVGTLEPPAVWSTTLLVESESVDHVAVRVNGFRVATVTRGRNCVRLPAGASPLELDLVALGQAAHMSEPIRLAREGHRALRIGIGTRLEHDILSVRPAERGCRAG